MEDIRDRKKKTDRPKGQKEEENKMKLNKVQAMDINQLDMVAGGSYGEVKGDFDFLRGLGVTGYKFSLKEVIYYWGDTGGGVPRVLEKQWNKVGITVVTKPFRGNCYSLGNKTLTRGEAFAHARNFVNAQKK